jgi:hypothetical protein
MDSGLLLSIFTSWEVIAVCICVMLFLPLVFYVASTKSRKKPVQNAASKSHKPKPLTPRPEAPEAPAGRPGRAGEAEEPEEQA